MEQSTGHGSSPRPLRCGSVRHHGHGPGARTLDRAAGRGGGLAHRVRRRRCCCVVRPRWRAGRRWAPRRPWCCSSRRLRRRSTRRASSRRSPTPAWRSARSWRSARRPPSPVCSRAPSRVSGSTGAGARPPALACAGVCLLVLGGSAGARCRAPGVGARARLGRGLRRIRGRRQAHARPRRHARGRDGGRLRDRAASCSCRVLAFGPSGGLATPAGAGPRCSTSARSRPPWPTSCSPAGSSASARARPRRSRSPSRSPPRSSAWSSWASGPGAAAAAGAALVLAGLGLLALRPAAPVRGSLEPAEARRLRPPAGQNRW